MPVEEPATPLERSIILSLRDELAATRQRLAAAEELCEIYFNLAADAIGEDEVRKRRDAFLQHD